MSAELEKALAELAEALDRAQKISGERDGLLLELGKLTRERDVAVAAGNRYKSLLFAQIVEGAANTSITKHGGRPKVLGNHVTSQLAVQELNGKFPVIVVDRDGKERHGLTVDSIVSDMRESPEYAAAFPEASEKPVSNPTTKNNLWSPESFNATLQAKMIKEKPGLAIHLQREAGRLTDGVAKGVR